MTRAPIALLLLCLASVATAQDPPPAQAGALTDEQLHDELRAVRADMERALNARDLDGLLKHLDEQVVFTTMNSDVARGPAAIKAYFQKMLEGPGAVVKTVQSHFEADDLSILHDRATAVAFGHTDDHYTLTDGSSFDVKARWSTTLLRKAGVWKIASFHYSTNVFDNPILSAQRRVLLLGGGGLAAVCALVACLVGWKLGKRQGRAPG
jgi:uncharacterized protein (TIGR02246 family)